MSDSVRRKRRVKKTRQTSKNTKVRMASAILTFSLAIAIVAWILNVDGRPSSGKKTSFEELRSVPVPEMPALAVNLVRACNAEDRDAKIVEVVKSTSVLARVGILPFVVGALAQNFPTNLEATMDTAIDSAPDLVLIFAHVVAQRLPNQMENISYVIGKKSPWNAEAIARTLAMESQDYDAITRGLKRGIPEYQPSSDDTMNQPLTGFIAVPQGQTTNALAGTNQMTDLNSTNRQSSPTNPSSLLAPPPEQN